MPQESHTEAVKPRSAWMFWEHPNRTLYRQTQVIDTAFARALGAAGWTRFRRAMLRLIDRLGA